MSLDVSEVDVMLVETGDPEGPFRAKGVAAIAIVPTAAAIAPALNHSLRVRLPRASVLAREGRPGARRDLECGLSCPFRPADQPCPERTI